MSFASSKDRYIVASTVVVELTGWLGTVRSLKCGDVEGFKTKEVGTRIETEKRTSNHCIRVK
eukprot:scaffold421330_cov55-Attheya_sp.AAC.4